MKRIFFLFLIVLLSASSFGQDADDPSSFEIEVEGEVQGVSKLVDPKQSDYPDCYYMTTFEVKRILSGSMSSGSINLSVPGFKDYKLTSFHLKKGDRIRCKIVAEELATEEEKKTQVCDDFDLFDRELYFLHSYQKIIEYSGGQLPVFSAETEYKSAWDECFNPPRTAQSIEERAKAIQKEKDHLKTGFPDSIDAEALQEKWDKDQAELPQIKPGYFWFQKGDSVYALFRDLRNYVDPDISQTCLDSSIPALIALNEYLKKQNVDLILVLYPDINSISIRAFYRDTVSSPIQPSNKIAQVLLDHDIEVIDVAPRLLPLLDSADFLFYYYHLNLHPGWETQQVAGKLVAERLKRYNIAPSLDPELFSEKEVLALDGSYLYPENLPIGSGHAGEPVKTQAIFYNNSATQSNPSSPIVLWGNSFLSWPKNFAFVTSVAKYHLNFCDIQQGAGCFTTMIRDLMVSPKTYLEGKKAVVIPISVPWLSITKFWNIKEMEANLIKNNNLTKRIPVSLPDSDFKDESIDKKAKEIGAEGVCYSITPKDGLHIPLPEITMNPDSVYAVEISYYNKSSLMIQYGETSVTTTQPGMFVIETNEFDYDQDAGEIVIQAKQNDLIFIEKIDICEYRKTARSK